MVHQKIAVSGLGECGPCGSSFQDGFTELLWTHLTGSCARRRCQIQGQAFQSILCKTQKFCFLPLSFILNLSSISGDAESETQPALLGWNLPAKVLQLTNGLQWEKPNVICQSLVLKKHPRGVTVLQPQELDVPALSPCCCLDVSTRTFYRRRSKLTASFSTFCCGN